MRRALAHDEGPARLKLVRGACPALMRELPALVMDSFDPEDTQQRTKSREVMDHSPDALRYALCAEALPMAQTAPQRAIFG